MIVLLNLGEIQLLSSVIYTYVDTRPKKWYYTYVFLLYA